ncbi:LysM peptidoglycan-binding domain-containing protein [Zafaria sp. Z1313]|uniref:LysM peptidoglycan-binding domain-containing protein n=1 Tax=unclassified Zafaria TaxID=2828765 RepID=UPI002E79EFCB|nr:LysM domain-containing protein [Zafaria sp. J156]MEE1620308.1 LysM domain-containing protein [Zafaria sp. J156]
MADRTWIRDAGYTGAFLALGILLLLSGASLHDSGREAATSWDRFEQGAALAVSALGLSVLAWWVLSAAAAVAAVLLQRAGHLRVAGSLGRAAPAHVRRLAAVVLGANLLVAPAAQAVPAAPSPAWGAERPASTGAPSPAWEARSAEHPPTVRAAMPATAPDPAWRAERPAAPLGPALGSGQRTAEEGTVVVLAGDTLWSIAARSIGPEASEAEIAREWPRWYRANQSTIGPNPDLLAVGTILMRPGR